MKKSKSKKADKITVEKKQESCGVEVLFNSTHNYNGRIFEAGKSYKLIEEIPGFIQRWINRGCTIVDSAKQEMPSSIIEEKIETVQDEIIESEDSIEFIEKDTEIKLEENSDL